MGTLSDYAVGVGTSDSVTSQLTTTPTQSLRAGDLAFVPNTNGQTPVNLYYWMFDPTSTAVVQNIAPAAVLADIAVPPAAPGRWRRLNVAFVTAPAPLT